jgi:hypothetical protein
MKVWKDDLKKIKQVNGSYLRPNASPICFSDTLFCDNVPIKEQIHEIVVEMLPWSSRLRLN